MEYVLAALAFVATVVGIRGDTWEAGRPTLVGWIAGTLALVVLVLSVVSHFQQQREQAKIAEVAHIKVLRSIHGVLEPFAIMLADSDLRRKVPGTGPTELNTQLAAFVGAREEDLEAGAISEVLQILPQLLEHTESFGELTLGDTTVVLQNPSPAWGQLFRATAVRSLAELDSTMNTYRSVLSSESVSSIEALRTTWLAQRVAHVQEHEPSEELINFLRLADTIPDTPAPIYLHFLQEAAAANRAVLQAHGR